jgi:hypothetical protein
MILIKIDRPRRIDQFIDYFGEPFRASSGERPPEGGSAVDPRTPRRTNAA